MRKYVNMVLDLLVVVLWYLIPVPDVSPWMREVSPAEVWLEDLSIATDQACVEHGVTRHELVWSCNYCDEPPDYTSNRAFVCAIIRACCKVKPSWLKP